MMTNQSFLGCAMNDGNSVTTKLLTLLNVSATTIDKRKRVDEFVHSETKLNKRARRSVAYEQSTPDAAQGPREEMYSVKEGASVEGDETNGVDEAEGMI